MSHNSGDAPVRITLTLYILWYIKNNSIHRGLKMETEIEIITKCASIHKQCLLQYMNVETILFLDNTSKERKFKSTKAFELVK